MKGKAGLVIGLAAGYVLGARAGRQRYEQIKEQALKLWNLDPVQKQVSNLTDLGKTAALSLPSTLWNSAVKVTRAATQKGDSAGERVDAAKKAGKESADDIAKAWDAASDEVAQAADSAADHVATAADEAAQAAKPADGS